MKQSRTHNCGELRLADAGKKVTLAGWMENVRAVSASLAFVVIRDFYGTTQLVIETEEMMGLIRSINKESTISVTGLVRERASKNLKLPTGEIEVVPESITVTGRCRYNQPRGGRGHAPEIPLPRPAQPGREEQHHPALPGRGGDPPADDRARLS